jgi:hypothetical protein
MIQLQVDGIYIDLYDLEPPKLNFTIEDIRDTAARSIFSRTFRVPASAKNTELFKTAFDVNGVDFDIRQKRSARIYVNGILFRTGQIRLNRIYDNREGARIDYELIFLGETKDFGTSVGEGYLNELDLSEYTHELDITNAQNSWRAYPEGSITDGLFEGDVLYPLIDFGVNYDEDGEPIETRISQNNVGNHFTQSGAGKWLPINRFKPMVRAKVIWDKIFEEAGYTYTSNFINSNRFKQMYLSAFGNTTSITTENNENELNVRLLSLDYILGDLIIPYNEIITDAVGNFNTTTYKYIAPITGTYTIRATFYGILDGTSGSPIPGEFGELGILLKRNTTTLDSDSFIVQAGGYNSTNMSFDTGNINILLNAGDEIYLEAEVIDPQFSSYYISYSQLFVTSAPGDISIAPLLDNEYKKIDFIKDILTKFRLVMVPNKNIVGDFIVEPWSEYIGSGDLFDWTHKLDLTKDFVSEPVFYTQSARILFEDSEGEDFLNLINQERFAETFGKLIVNGDNEFLQGERSINTNFIPVPITQIERKNTSIGQTFIIPQIHVHEPGEDASYNPQHLPIRQNRHLLFYNGLKDTDGIDWYIENDTASNPHDDYPMVSFYEDFPNTSSSLNLNWQKETGYIEHNINNGLLGQSVYDRYWNDYINSLYDGFARRITAYFILDDVDLLDFSFDDVIRVKNAYYYVSKITDAVIGKKSSVKVELIKLLNYDVPLNPVPPRRIWNETFVNWENAVFRWDL